MSDRCRWVGDMHKMSITYRSIRSECCIVPFLNCRKIHIRIHIVEAIRFLQLLSTVHWTLLTHILIFRVSEEELKRSCYKEQSIWTLNKTEAYMDETTLFSCKTVVFRPSYIESQFRIRPKSSDLLAVRIISPAFDFDDAGANDGNFVSFCNNFDVRLSRPNLFFLITIIGKTRIVLWTNKSLPRTPFNYIIDEVTYNGESLSTMAV